MQRLAPYQIGLWLAEYLNLRCQLCRIYKSEPQTKLDSLAISNSSRFAHQFFRKGATGLLCSHCHNSLPWLPPTFHVDIAAASALSIQASTYYDYPIRQAFRAFKHHEDMTKLPLLVHILRQLPRPYGCHGGNSVIVSMPTTADRLLKRGFDPVTILSAYLSKHWQIPLWHGVQRIDSTISQQGLTRAERLANLDVAFIVTESPPVKRLLLFDDIATTGASLQALAQALYSSSAPSPNLSSMPASSNLSHPQLQKTTADSYFISAYALAHGSDKSK